jgi:2-octaprenyl-6-methoxyphenol hydroxylase
MLDAYARARHADIRLRVAGIDALNRASQADAPFVRDLRATGVRILHDLTPVRRGLMRLGLGAGRGDN